MTVSLPSRQAIAALVAGDHGDPFAILGPHRAPDGAVDVRVFEPGARAIAVIDAKGRSLGSLQERHEAGFFAGPIRARDQSVAYRLRIDYGSGAVEREDPYRFPPVLGELDVHLIAEGNHLRLHETLGARVVEVAGVAGTAFAVWAPNARRVSVVGDFNRWDGRVNPMRNRNGVWEIFLPGTGTGTLYKFEIKGRDGTLLPLKADPCGLFFERPPGNAAIVTDPRRYAWRDTGWRTHRAHGDARRSPMAIYEVHLGSWRRRLDEGGRYLWYGELADQLVPYVADMGFTHVELLPVAEHPFDGSWGYQPLGLFAPTSRFGAPDDFRALVDRFHAAGIGVIVDWVPGHFPSDPHGLGWFDGTHLYEHADPRQGRHMDWDTLIYNFGRNEVANYLIANALYWADSFHIDGLRVDAVASMLYLDYSREPGSWIPNRYGGNENLEAIAFLRRLNTLAYGRGEGLVTIAEESTAWPMVSRPVHAGGLGFGFKWNMGWMNDTLAYMREDPIHRRWHHDKLTFGLLYAFNENFVLPLSHDEVVHGKGSLWSKMPGDRWQKFANLRLYYTFFYTQPGKKLLFMGGEFAQVREWNHDIGLDWQLLDDPMHAGVHDLVRDLNRIYRGLPALHEADHEPHGFAWIDCNDAEGSVVSYIRRGDDHRAFVVVVCNFTPVVRHDYRIGVPEGGFYRERLNSDAAIYGGSGLGNAGGVAAEQMPCHGHAWSLRLTLPPLAAVVFLAPGCGDTGGPR